MKIESVVRLLSPVLLMSAVAGVACGGGNGSHDAGSDASSDGDTPLDGDGLADADADIEQEFAPTAYCPGSTGCSEAGEGELFVGAGQVEITPDVELLTVDVNGDGVYDEDDGDEFTDLNGNRRFDQIWLAGFDAGRAALGTADPQWARAIVLQEGETTIALVSIDCVGLFYEDVQSIRAGLEELDIDYVSVSATRTHGARDSMGFWGPGIFTSGLDLGYLDDLRAAAVEAVRDAVDDLRAADVEHSSFRLRDQPGGMLAYVTDSRDPKIIDDELRLMRFVEEETDTTIATVINFSARADYAGSSNQMLTSDIAHWIRTAVEEGVIGPDGEPLDGVGGIALFFAGALGCQVGSGESRVPDSYSGEFQPLDWDGSPLEETTPSLALSETIGSQIGYFALQALGGEDVVREPNVAIGFRYYDFLIIVENTLLQTAFRLGLMPTREAHDYDRNQPAGPGNMPRIWTQLAVIDIGLATIITVPGHLDPALLQGGFDGSFTPVGQDLVDDSRVNPPEIPDEIDPPLIDFVRDDAEQVFLFGITNDEIGYFILPFDHELHREDPYVDFYPGSHYEETFSLGPEAWPTVERNLQDLLEWRPE